VGWLVLLRRLDGEFIRELDKTLDADAQFVAPASERNSLPSVPLQRAELKLEAGDGNVRSASFVVGLLPDGLPLRLRLSTERPLSATVAKVSTYFFWASLVCGMVVALLAVRWVQRRLLAPLDTISRRLQEIGVTNDLSARLPDVGHRDEVTGVVTAANHLLEQIQSKREVELARDAALQASRAKSEFLARMSHEIRTPMNGVLGMTELMMSTALDTRQRQIADTIQQSAQSLLGIINDTLDYSRIEAGKLAIDSSPFDLAQIVDSAVDLMAERAAAKGLELLCDLPADRRLRFIGDGLRLRQVLVNLLANAVKFTERGEVQVRVTVEGPAAAAGTAVRVEVIDTGIGIRLENQDSVFDSYSQEDTSTTRKYGGTGLGLAICRQLLGLMGGRIGVQSVPDQGSTFWFSLTLPEDPSASATASPDLKGQRVMLALANPTARAVLHRRFRALNAGDILEADGRQAALSQLDLEAGAGRRLDIILVDVPGAEGGGIDIAERARTHALYAASTIVLLTGICTQIPEERWRRAGASASFTKPLTHAAFLQIIAGFPAAGSSHSPGMLAPARPVLGDDLSGMRVLVVEDNPVNQEVARGMLEHLGCLVTLAVDGEQGVRAATSARFDAVLMDCHMPVLDGYMAARQIREWEAQHGVSRCIIIALTANALQGDRQKCLDAGMDDHLSKPFSAEQLKGMLLLHEPPRSGLGSLTRTG
jgi:two-component system, sensor histidine kinase and response regulator